MAACSAAILAANACGGDSSTRPDGGRFEIVHSYGVLRSDSTIETNLVFTSPDGTGSRTLADIVGSENYPEWSPDGRRILFQRTGDGRPWVIDENGANMRLLFTATGLYYRWSPDGQEIVYLRNVGVAPYAIVVVRADGTGERVVSADGVSEPSWSPDGRIAFRRSGGGIWTVRSDGTQLTQLTTGPELILRWSPDGSHLLLRAPFAGDGKPAEGISVIDADGSNRRVLTMYESDASDDFPTWSPDGQWILYSHTRYSATVWGCELRKVPVTGGTPIVVVPQQPYSRCSGASWRR